MFPQGAARFLVLASDYDGTLAAGGRIDDETIAALERLRSAGKRIILVTGRQLDDLASVCPRLDLFDMVVGENGAVLFTPKTRETRLLCGAVPEQLWVALERRGVPASRGLAIVATWTPHETTVLDAIRDLGLELQVIFNKGAVMILPSGVNKATGLTEALRQLGSSPGNTVGVGDAENDHALLGLCGASAAVANALPSLKEAADIVLSRDHGAGVRDLIESMLRHDLADLLY